VRARALAAIVAGLASLIPLSADSGAAPALGFSEVGMESGLTYETVAAKPPWKFIIDNLGTGVGMLDYDLDGNIDIFQVQSSTLDGFEKGKEPTDHLYRGDGKGHFTDVTAAAGISVRGWGFGVAVGDFDNDGDPDIFISSWGPNRLYRNEGNGTFTEIGESAGVADRGWGASAAFFDYDGDGLLDLYVTNYVDFDPAKVPPAGDPDHPCTFRGLPVVCGPRGLSAPPHILYRNRGDGTFVDASAESGINKVTPYFGLGVVTGDIDNDGDQDIFVANDSSPNYLFRNEGNGRFTEDGVIAGVAYSGDGREQAGMGCDMGDPDGDGDLDIFVNNFSHDYSTLYLNDGAGNFEDESLRAGLVEPTIRSLSWGTSFVDFDNDGDEDLFISNSHVYPEADEANIGSTFLQRCQVFLNDGTARFTEFIPPPDSALSKPNAHRGAAFGDIDGDGDIDVVVSRMFATPALFRNDLKSANHWVSLRLVGTRSNRDAVGARAWLTYGGRRHLLERKGGGSYSSANDPRLHLGMGDARKIEVLEIRWPSGSVSRMEEVAGDRVVTVIEPGGAPASQ